MQVEDPQVKGLVEERRTLQAQQAELLANLTALDALDNPRVWRRRAFWAAMKVLLLLLLLLLLIASFALAGLATR